MVIAAGLPSRCRPLLGEVLVRRTHGIGSTCSPACVMRALPKVLPEQHATPRQCRQNEQVFLFFWAVCCFFCLFFLRCLRRISRRWRADDGPLRNRRRPFCWTACGLLEKIPHYISCRESERMALVYSPRGESGFIRRTASGRPTFDPKRYCHILSQLCAWRIASYKKSLEAGRYCNSANSKRNFLCDTQNCSWAIALRHMRRALESSCARITRFIRGFSFDSGT